MVGQKATEERSPSNLGDLPDIVYVRDLANWLRTSEKAIRDRVSRGQLPKPGWVGRRCAWSRAIIARWAGENTAGRPDMPKMRITLRPYHKDPTRFHVDLQFDNPVTMRADRKRLVAPAGLTDRQAERWGMNELAKQFRTLTTPEIHSEEKAPIPPKPVQVEQTLERFYRDDFLINYVSLQRPATQNSYDTLWRNHLSVLGPLPLRAIDEHAIDKFRAEMTRKKLGGSTINVLLAKLQKVLSWARKHKAIDVIPEIDKVKVDHKERPHYDMAQIHQLRAMFDGLSAEDAVVFLLAFEGGLRTGEIAALRWEDIDLANGVIKIRRTLSRGVEGPPKGTVGDVGLTNSLIKALARLEKRGPRVLYRCSHFTKGVYAGHSSGSVRIALNRMQRAAGMDRTGLHILRHSGITFLADQGADVHTLKAFARHARLQTTEGYLHQSKQRLTRAAARLFDGNALATPGTTR